MSSSQPGALQSHRITVLLLLGVVGISLLAIQRGTTLALVLPFGIAALTLLFFRPATGTLLFLGLAYMNAPVLLGRALGSPQVAGIAVTALVGIPILAHVGHRRGFVVDYTLLLMVLFLCSLLGSTFVAKDTRIAIAWVTGYAIEGVLIYFLLVNAVRSFGVLRAAIWTLLLVGAFLASLGIYQEMTGSYRSQFGGLAQRNTERDDADDVGSGLIRERSAVHVGNRAAGPTGGPNRFAQILIVLLPLAFFRARDEASRPARLLAALCGLLILGGFFVTYSRGGFITLILLGLLMVLLGYIRVWQVVLGAAALTLVVAIVAPGFSERIDTLRVIPQLLTQRDSVQGNGAIRGRMTEMLAAFHVFLDYPVLGVGPGQYTPFYSMQYMENPDIAFKAIDKTRRSHCLYSEVAAETGLVGILLFLGIIGSVAARLWRLRAILREQRERANLAAAFWLGIMAYLGTAVFLQLSFQRYLWLFLALAGATVQVLSTELRQAQEAREQA